MPWLPQACSEHCFCPYAFWETRRGTGSSNCGLRCTTFARKYLVPRWTHVVSAIVLDPVLQVSRFPIPYLRICVWQQGPKTTSILGASAASGAKCLFGFIVELNTKMPIQYIKPLVLRSLTIIISSTIQHFQACLFPHLLFYSLLSCAGRLFLSIHQKKNHYHYNLSTK